MVVRNNDPSGGRRGFQPLPPPTIFAVGKRGPKKAGADADPQRGATTTEEAYHTGRRLGEFPPPAGDMSPEGREVWRRRAVDISGRIQIDPMDLPAFRQLCETEANIVCVQDEWVRQGRPVSVGEDGRAKHPAVQTLATLMPIYIRLLQHFGLTPASREKVDFDPRAPQDNRRNDGDEDADPFGRFAQKAH